MKRGVLFTLLIPAALLPIASKSPAHSPGESSVLHTPFTAPAMTCANCKTCGLSSLNHDAPSAENGNVKNPHTYCLEFSGCDGHPGCSETFNSPSQRLDSLVVRVLAGDTKAVGTIITEFSGIAEYNSARQALQIRGGCGPDVIAIPSPFLYPQCLLRRSRTGSSRGASS